MHLHKRFNEYREKWRTWEIMVSIHCITLLEHVTIMKTSCFDSGFVSQMKLTKLPLIHRVEYLGHIETQQATFVKDITFFTKISKTMIIILCV